jgi:hypothetical protein
MSLELPPFLLGWLPVLGLGPQRSTLGKEGSVGTDELVLEHG